MKQLKQPTESNLIVLYGKKNHGKTTTLIKLLELLANGKSQILSDINKYFYKSGKATDCRIVVEYNNMLILIATFGDSWEYSRVNTDFFEFIVDGKTTMFLMDASGVKPLSRMDYLNYKDRTIQFYICACRSEGDGFGAMKAYLSYMEQSVYKFAHILWIRKDKWDVDPSNKKASIIWGIINGKINSVKVS